MGGSSNRGSSVYNVVKSILCDIRFLAKRRKLMRLKMVILSFPPAESVFLGDLRELVLELDFNPFGESGVGAVGGAGMDGSVVDALFLGVVAGKAGDDRDVAEGDRKLVGDYAGDAAVAVEKGVDADEIVVKMGEEAANFVDVADLDEFDAVVEVAGEAIEFVVNFGAAAGNAV